ncbi:hypothetical protein DFO73_105126 [Cytobacillus oceanisediminis]|uniref:Uncharacterized protein n=1 Tax=Cytobacillus oceanisediminis TaxID=665099 RepID=A0A2V2ZY30_9BACI|nr:hypothetical protein DFO73_105126 [Cytobacillus oceanisediminis]
MRIALGISLHHRSDILITKGQRVNLVIKAVITAAYFLLC